MSSHILVVEDSPTQSLLLEGLLVDAGFEVASAVDGLAALEHLKTNSPALVVSDVTMPRMDGYQLCRAIRADARFENLPVLLLTSLSDNGEVIAGLEAGADAFSTKPYDGARLLDRIRELIAGSVKPARPGAGDDSEVRFSGKSYRIVANRSRILRYLLSTYDSALQINARLSDSEAQLHSLNMILEEKVESKTVALTQETEQRKSAQHTVQVSKEETQEALDSREYAESIIDAIREPLIALDQDLRVVSVSRSFYEVFKVKPEETLGQLIYDLGNKQWDIPKLRDLLETILPEKSAFDDYEVEHVFSTIGRRVMLLNARQIQRASGKASIILLAIEDITARREVESGLERTRKELERIKISEDDSREYLGSLIDTIRESLIVLNQDLRVVSVSRSFYEVFKVKPEETVGQLIYDLGNKQWDIPKLRDLLETILPHKASFENYEVEHDFANIGKRIMLLNARQIQRASGKERTILLAIEDITERKEIETGLEVAHKELEDLTSELKRVARAKSEFLANMSHELRTPLNSINGFSEVLYDETFGPLNEKQKKYVNNVLTSGKHLLLLINQILDMAKVESGKMRLTLSNLPIRQVLNEIASLVTDLAGKKGIQIERDIAEDLPVIEADELKVKEIIYNLLSNAVKFTPDGGGIGLRAKREGDMVEIVVWDTGVGIAQENMGKIFEGFFRVDTPYSRLTEGTGLGLPLSKKLVELHGGQFFIESAGLEKGTLVRFTLPIISSKDE